MKKFLGELYQVGTDKQLSLPASELLFTALVDYREKSEDKEDGITRSRELN